MRSDAIFKSYVKTTVACLVLFFVALLFVFVGLYCRPITLGRAVAVMSFLVAIGAAGLSVAGAVVLIRYRRSALSKHDLFLALNKSREPAALMAHPQVCVTNARRWFAKLLLGHELIAGDLVEIKTWDEIRATLDERGCLDELPFMPEMLSACGQRAQVFRCAHRVFDYRKTRRMRHMNGAVLLVGAVCDGSSHGRCEAACHTVWKAAWLRRVLQSTDTMHTPESFKGAVPVKDAAILQFGTQAPRYACQLTQLNAASQPIGNWSMFNFLRPLVSGNIAPAAFAVGWLTHLFNVIQQKRQGAGFPAFEVARTDSGRGEETQLKAGDQVFVRSSGEIRGTLNDRMLNRGLYFEPDMLKHCGRRHRVQSEVKTIIDIVTGEMLMMKTPAYVLSDVRFSGERQQFNTQYEPLYWRAAWLSRDDTAFCRACQPERTSDTRCNAIMPAVVNGDRPAVSQSSRSS